MFSELRLAEKEAYMEKKIAELQSLYSAAQKKLVDRLRNEALTDFQKMRATAMLKQIEVTITALNREAYVWAKDAAKYSYVRGIDISADRLKKLKVTRFVNYDAKIHTSAVDILTDDITLELITANEAMKKNISRFIRQTQQAILQEKAISKSIAEGLIEGQTRRQISSELLTLFKERLKGEQLIPINGRYYRPDKYAALVARTRTREATTNGILNTAIYYGVDLVQWSVHEENCEFCQQLAGRVFSISGTHKDFPPLEEYPPLHPHCKCVITPITEQSIEQRGQYDNLVALSISDTVKIDSFTRFQEALAAT